MRRKAAEVETGEVNSVLGVLTKHNSLLDGSSSDNQRNRGQQNRMNGSGNQELDGINRNGVHKSNHSNSTQNATSENGKPSPVFLMIWWEHLNIKCPTPLNCQGDLKTGLSYKTTVRQVDR